MAGKAREEKEKEHKCMVSKKLKELSIKILKDLEKKKLCSTEIEVILNMAMEVFRTKVIIARFVESIEVEAISQVSKHNTEATINPMNRPEFSQMGG